MHKSRFVGEQIIGVPKEHRAGTSTAAPFGGEMVSTRGGKGVPS